MRKEELIEINKIIKTVSRLKITDKKDFYKRALKHLKRTGQEFCFLENGEMINREDCQKIIKEDQ